MPLDQRTAQRPKNNQRLFRGRGGPTDRNLPGIRKKGCIVVGTKYNAQDKQTETQTVFCGNVPDSPPPPEPREHSISRLDHHGNTPQPPLSPLGRELEHLKNRIENVQNSLQLSQGLGNPSIWKTNCLFPTLNIVNEWRSICSFHLRSMESIDADDLATKTAGSDSQFVPTKLIHGDCPKVIIRDFSLRVFQLIQMAMQIGPLAGSNPGYFKRCGGHVAHMAFEFLSAIMLLEDEAVVETGSANCRQSNNSKGSCFEKNYTSPTPFWKEEQKNESGCHTRHTERNEHPSFLYNDLMSDSISSDDSEFESGDISSVYQIPSPTHRVYPHPQCTKLPSDLDEKNQTQNDLEIHEYEKRILNLQANLNLTKKQSQMICQWMRNARKAMVADKPPSKSAKKVQSQKSKKQRMKDLKKERQQRGKGGKK